MPVNEKGLQKAIVKAILIRWPDSWIFHPVGNPYQQVGVPDLLMCVEGHFYAMELKQQKPGESHEHMVGRVTETQRNEIRNINAAGGTAAAIFTVEDALDLIERRVKSC